MGWGAILVIALLFSPFPTPKRELEIFRPTWGVMISEFEHRLAVEVNEMDAGVPHQDP